MFRVPRIPCGELAFAPNLRWQVSSAPAPRAKRLLIALSVAASCLLSPRGVSAAGPAPKNGPEILQQLAKKWASEDKPIANASIRFRAFLQGSLLKPCTPAEIAEKVRDVDFVSDPEAMRRFLSGIYPFGPIPPGVHMMRTPDPWGMMEFKMSGEKRREDTLDTGDVQIATPDIKIESDQANRQIHVFAARGSNRGMADVADFRFVPKFFPSMSVRSVDGPIAVIVTSPGKYGHGEFRVDIESGALLERVFYDLKGQAMQQFWQGGWTVFPGGVHLPRWKIEAHYDPGGKLQALSMSYVEKATLNKPVRDDEFHLVAVKGVTVFDHRVPGRLGSFRLRSDTSDIATAVDNPLFKGDFD
jgi:hypothetical protein